MGNECQKKFVFVQVLEQSSSVVACSVSQEDNEKNLVLVRLK